jgi:hypothetical protein
VQKDKLSRRLPYYDLSAGSKYRSLFLIPTINIEKQRGYKKMDTTKYGKYILRKPLGKSVHPEIQVPIISIGRNAPVKEWDGAALNMTIEAITSPIALGGHGHTHDYDEVLCFMGSNPLDYHDFGAEAYIILGEEGEKHIINSTSFIYIPKGLMHCPLVFTKVDKPVVFGFIEFSAVYTANKKPEDL